MAIAEAGAEEEAVGAVVAVANRANEYRRSWVMDLGTLEFLCLPMEMYASRSYKKKHRDDTLVAFMAEQRPF